mmetsp:Transcript_10492/g.27904  ORF Transcript_10492/g.27904 Transcript_10492/m.27904 type:complete len:252 (-) Transcript_10492:2607-3362(-)
MREARGVISGGKLLCEVGADAGVEELGLRWARLAVDAVEYRAHFAQRAFERCHVRLKLREVLLREGVVLCRDRLNARKRGDLITVALELCRAPNARIVASSSGEVTRTCRSICSRRCRLRYEEEGRVIDVYVTDSRSNWRHERRERAALQDRAERVARGKMLVLPFLHAALLPCVALFRATDRCFGSCVCEHARLLWWNCGWGLGQIACAQLELRIGVDAFKISEVDDRELLFSRECFEVNRAGWLRGRLA